MLPGSPGPGLQVQVEMRQLPCKPKGRPQGCGNVERGVHTQPGGAGSRRELPSQGGIYRRRAGQGFSPTALWTFGAG